MERIDLVVKWGVGIGGAGIGFVFGGFTMGMAYLFLAVILDFVTGWIAGAKTTGLLSKTSYDGIKRKVFIFVMVAVGHMLDSILGPTVAVIVEKLDFGFPVELLSEGHVIRDAIVIAYLLNEILSITENAGKAGLWIPSFVKKIIAVLKPAEENKGGE